jgi:hypothetical protein
VKYTHVVRETERCVGDKKEGETKEKGKERDQQKNLLFVQKK